MIDPGTSIALAPGLEDLTTPSIRSVRTTFAALQHSADQVIADCRSVCETLEALGQALDLLTHGGGSQEWGGFGMIGLPVLGALRAVKGLAGHYVKQQTGSPLGDWTELVAGSVNEFTDYLARLDAMVALAQRHHDSASTTIDPESLREDEALLLELRWRTQAWKQVLGRVGRLGQVVDAVLAAEGGEQRPPEPAADRGNGLSGTLQRRLKEVQTRTLDRSGDLHEWVLRPFVDVRDRVGRLPGQVRRLADEVALLELLLDLEVAQLRACTGRIQPDEARVVGIRVAAGVMLPELARRREQQRTQVEHLRGYLERLAQGRLDGTVSDRTHGRLAAEYTGRLDAALTRLGQFDAEAEGWLRHGRVVLAACLEWVDQELELVAARRLAGEDGGTGDHLAALRRERTRLEQATDILSTL
jgi:hypothetical protein